MPRRETATDLGRYLCGPDTSIGRVALIALAPLLIAGWAATVDADWSRLALDCVLGWTLLALAWIDWRSFRLPDLLTLPLLMLGLVSAWLDAPDVLLSCLIGAIAGYAALLLVDLCYRCARGRAGLGRGDAKLLAAGGAWLGWQALPWVVLLAALLGLALAVLQRARGIPLTRETALPFGPPLALAIWVVRIHGIPGV